MKKLLFTLIVLGGTALSSFAQSTTTANSTASNVTGNHGGFSIGVDAGIPTGEASSGYSFAVGGSIKYDVPIFASVCITISAGYQTWLVKNALQLPGPKTDNFIPLKAGLKVYVSPGFFLEGQGGIAIHTRAGGDVLYAYSPGIGYSFSNGFEIGARYESWTNYGYGTFSQISARIAFRFN